VLRPRLLLLDEPFGALDPTTRQAMRSLLRSLLAGQATATVCVTHSPLEALAIGDRVAVLERGRIEQEGAPGDLLRHPRSPVVARFLGINFFRGTIARRDGAGLVEIRTESGAIAAVDPGGDDDVFAAVDPRHIVLARTAPTGSARNVFQGSVAEISPEPPTGERVRVALSTEPPLVAELTAEAVAALELRVGTPVYAAFKATGVSPYR
jgi:molybdate transport system ATP-binding protein